MKALKRPRKLKRLQNPVPKQQNRLLCKARAVHKGQLAPFYNREDS